MINSKSQSHQQHEHANHVAHDDHDPDQHHTGHQHHGGHGDHVAQFRRLFWINLIVGIPVVVFSPMFGHLLGYTVPG